MNTPPRCIYYHELFPFQYTSRFEQVSDTGLTEYCYDDVMFTQDFGSIKEDSVFAAVLFDPARPYLVAYEDYNKKPLEVGFKIIPS